MERKTETRRDVEKQMDAETWRKGNGQAQIDGDETDERESSVEIRGK